MVKLAIIVLVFLLSEASAFDRLCKDNCPKGEVYSKCAAGRCQATCWRSLINDCACVPGCVCGPGTIRDPHTFECIPIAKCPKQMPGQCPKNEQWTACNGDKGCQRTCATLDVQFKCPCTPGCACKPGYVRCTITGQCIPLAECKTCPVGYSKNPKTNRCEFCCDECGENEEYRECGTACEPVCGVVNPLFCILKCVQGCFCKAGFIRDKATKKCIPQSFCDWRSLWGSLM